MFRHLTKVRIEFNPFDSRNAAALEFLAQCNSPKVRQSNPKCELVVKRRTDQCTPSVTVTFANGKQKIMDASVMHANQIRKGILTQSENMETEQLFRDAGLEWPVIIPVNETESKPST